MSDRPPADDRLVHISSALIHVRPGDLDAVRHRLAALPDTDLVHHDGSRLVLVMEAADTRSLGDRLAAIAGWPGVLAANMVFEQAESEARLQEVVQGEMPPDRPQQMGDAS